jgi:hypothetical protein
MVNRKPRLSDLSDEDKELAYENIKQQHGGNYCREYFKNDVRVVSSFNWSATKQGLGYWFKVVSDICSGEYIIKEPTNLFKEVHNIIKEINKNN